MHILSLILLSSPSALAAEPGFGAPGGGFGAPEPVEIASVTTDAGTSDSSSGSMSFSTPGVIRVVGLNADGVVAGRCNVAVSGGPSQTLPLSEGSGIYHTTPGDAVGRIGSELVFPTDRAWGRATVTVSYDAGYSAASGSDVNCTAWFQPAARITTGSTELLSLVAGPSEVGASTSTTVDFPYDGYLVLGNQSDDTAYGGGAIILAIDGLEYVEYGVGDPAETRPSRLAVPVSAGGAVDLELYYDDDTTGDNIGTRAVSMSFIADL